MEENRKKIHDMVDCMDTEGMLAYWETFMRRWLGYWGHGCLDKMAKKYNIIMLASVQLAEYTKGKLFLDASVLSNAKQIKEQLENLFLMRTVYTEELDPKSKYYCHPFRLKKVNDKWIEEEYNPDPNAVWRAIFTEKCRSGANSSDNGVGYLLRYDGDHCIFREVAQARFKHGEIR